MVTVTISLDKLPCLGYDSKLNILNRLVQTREALMLHELATSTGCSQQEAMLLLMLLYDLHLAELFLLVYHKDHIDTPIQSRGLLEGFLSVPFTCQE